LEKTINNTIENKKTAFDGVSLFVLDMDGTVYLGENLIDGSLDFIHKVVETGRDYVFFTNNASRVPSMYVEKLKRMGLTVTEDRIITAGDVTAEYLKKDYPGAAVYLNGTSVLEDNFKQHGIRLVQDNPDVAVQSFDTTLTYDKMDRICNFVRDGVPFIATHPDINCPTEDGFMPDCGAMCAMIESSTGKKPVYLGKPYPATMEMVTDITGISPEHLAFVGDRIYTDVATGVNNGGRGFLVLTGEADMQTVMDSDVIPDCIFESLKEMAEYL
jgi:4-nitrophenyl phosphatase